MKQIETLDQLRPLIRQTQGINGAVLIGSFARGTQKWNSDIDLSFWVDRSFDPHLFIDQVKSTHPNPLRFGLFAQLRRHLSLYFSDQSKVDIGLFDSMEGMERNFLGSEIQDIEKAILFDPNSALKDYLSTISRDRKSGGIADHKAVINQLVDKFLFEFEQFSDAHKRSDSYKSYFFYNIALHTAVQIEYLARGHRAFYFLPKNFTSQVLEKEYEKVFRKLSGTLYLPEVNGLKKHLTDFFLEGVRKSCALEAKRLEEVEAFCQWVYDRDFIWNFRDMAEVNPKIKPGLLYRSSSLTRYQHEDFFSDLLNEKQIRKIIDLRDHDELAKNPYDFSKLHSIKHCHIPIDPRQQSADFRANHLHGTHREIAYRFFALECKRQVKQFFEELTASRAESTVFHCHAGKDRTGVFATLIHLLSRADEGMVMMDYQASEMDSVPEMLNVFLGCVESAGGVQPYLLDCGITPETLTAFQQRYFKQTA